MKNISKVILAFAVSMSMTATALAAPATKYSFTDISTAQYEWAAPSIEAMSKKGLINGYEDGTFRPDNEVTRLECLSLFARAMGSSDEVNEPIIALAKEKYEDTIKKYSLSWGSDEIAYLLYKGALKTSDLDTYLKGSEKDAAMKRYEAAIIITKAMGGEEAALAEQGVVLDYTDAKTIPNNAIQYVGYASEKEIMKGMEDGSFMPMGSVLRSQMAVMLERVVNATNYSFSKAKLNAVDVDTRNVISKTADGTEKKDVYTDDTVMRVAGAETQPKNMVVGLNAIFTYSGKKLVAIDTLSSTPDETITGKFAGYASSNGNINITIIPTGETTGVTYKCSPDVSMIFNNSPATINNFTKDDYISAEIVNGEISTLSGSNKTTTVQGLTVEKVTIEETALTMTVSSADDEYDGKVFDISSTVSVTKNGKKSDMSEIYSGDTVEITFQYGIVTKIVATSKVSTVEGNIVSITIASRPSMTVNVNGKDVSYDIPADCTITINGKEGSLYDFRVGDKVTLTTESNAITKIKAETTQISSGMVTGVVTAVNTSYGFINILPDGDSVPTTVYCKDTKTKFITTGGTTKKLSDVQAGMTVTANGTVADGAFSATLVVIQE